MSYRRGYVCLMLFSLITINYLDRAVLPVAAKDVAADFHFSPIAMGYLFSSFVWTYALCTLFSGLLIDRIASKRIQIAGVAMWSTATMLMGAVWSFPSLLVLRLLMGAAEATSLPTANKMVREWIPARERGMATAWFSSGSFAGPALGALLVGAISSLMGWRAAFIVAGSLGLIWLIPFCIWFDTPERAKFLSPEERAKILAERGGSPSAATPGGDVATLLALLRTRTFWGLAITQASAIYANNVFLFWLPSYLQSTRNLSIMKTGLFTALPYALAVLLSIGVGILSDALIRRQGVLTGGRRTVIAIAMIGSAVILLAPLVGSTWVLLALVTISLTGIGTVLALNLALISDLLPDPRAIGKAVATVIFTGQLAGICAPIITGYIVSLSGNYESVFAIGGIFLIIGSSACLTMTRRPLLIAAAPVAHATTRPVGLSG